MGLETGTWVSDLVASNPPGTDKKNQGDDHLRLLKSVLQNTFPNATKAFRFPTSVSKNVDYTVLSSDQNKTIMVDTSGAARTLTLPTLAVGDYGWSITVVKSTTDTNPVFIAPASGTVSSGEFTTLSKTRRGIPNAPFRCIWTEGVWVIERCAKQPLGSVFPVVGNAPVGYALANGTSLSSSANFPDYFALGSTLVLPDLRGRVPQGVDGMGSSVTSRIGNTFGGATVPNTSGGAEFFQLVQNNLPNVGLSAAGLSFSGSGSASGISGSVSVTDTRGILVPDLSQRTDLTAGGASNAITGYNNGHFSAPNAAAYSGGTISGSLSGGSGSASVSGGPGSITGTVPTGGVAQGVANMTPFLLFNYAVVVE